MNSFSYLINLNPLLPVRCEPSERAEMITQLLFGETAKAIDENPKWIKIINDADGYTGWIDRKMASPLSYSEYGHICSLPVTPTTLPITLCVDSEGQTRWIPMGSKMYGWNRETKTACFAQKQFRCSSIKKINSPLYLAHSMLNAPYLWGGKSILGIDCSGLIQLVHAVSGCILPRDAADQAGCGKELPSTETPQGGDLAFFQNNDGKIIHVGLMVNNLQLIHASGKVRMDLLDHCNHQLHSLRRLL